MAPFWQRCEESDMVEFWNHNWMDKPKPDPGLPRQELNDIFSQSVLRDLQRTIYDNFPGNGKEFKKLELMQNYPLVPRLTNEAGNPYLVVFEDYRVLHEEVESFRKSSKGAKFFAIVGSKGISKTWSLFSLLITELKAQRPVIFQGHKSVTYLFDEDGVSCSTFGSNSFEVRQWAHSDAKNKKPLVLVDAAAVDTSTTYRSSIWFSGIYATVLATTSMMVPWSTMDTVKEFVLNPPTVTEIAGT
ncbi:hypothetical protein K438DRAFT_1768407 [Mycena galopus ATCC 62051]|nr:hypothetical protein K438DRAFT_1768407 [Mycena galopus ATCC 62051]